MVFQPVSLFSEVHSVRFAGTSLVISISLNLTEQLRFQSWVSHDS